MDGANQEFLIWVMIWNRAWQPAKNTAVGYSTVPIACYGRIFTDQHSGWIEVTSPLLFTSAIESLYTTEVYIPQDLAAHLGDSLLNSSTNQTTRFMTDSRIYAIRNTGRYPGAVCLACATKKTKQGGQGFDPPKSVRLDVLFSKLIFFSNLYCNTVLL